jgi:hypothetical protein
MSGWSWKEYPRVCTMISLESLATLPSIALDTETWIILMTIQESTDEKSEFDSLTRIWLWLLRCPYIGNFEHNGLKGFPLDSPLKSLKNQSYNIQPLNYFVHLHIVVTRSHIAFLICVHWAQFVQAFDQVSSYSTVVSRQYARGVHCILCLRTTCVHDPS